MRVFRFGGLFLVLFLFISHVAVSEELPSLSRENGRYLFHVNGNPFLILGVQINNSSAWPSVLPDVWPLLDKLPINTVEAPVYWEQLEPAPGQFDFSCVDALIAQARARKLRLILSWFGTWKNGKMHYAPEWVKTNPAQYPRVVNADGQAIDVLSAHSTSNLDADKAAFVTFMTHLKETDGEQHTVIMVQVENEPGIIGSARDYSRAAEAEFSQGVPPELARQLGKQPGSWQQLFAGDAGEAYEAYSVARYVEEIARAGKKVMALPLYVNVWQHYPLAKRYAGVDYPSGGATHNMLDIWHVTAPSIDMYAPDVYAEDAQIQQIILENYTRSYNPVWICESGDGEQYAPFLYLALGQGAIGVSTFGVDLTGWQMQSAEQIGWLKENLASLLPMEQQLAEWSAGGHLQTSVEQVGATRQTLVFGRWDAIVDYGTFGYDHLTAQPSGTAKHMGRALVAQTGPNEFIATGIDSTIQFQLRAGNSGHEQILSVEEGQFEHGVWVRKRIWNGDQTDYGMQFHHQPIVLKIKMGTY